MFAKAGPGLKGYIDPSGSELKCTPAGNTYVLGKLHAHLAHLCTKQQGQTKKRHDPQKPRKHENEQAKDQGSRSQLLEAMADSAEMRRCRSATCSRVHARDLDPRYLVKFSLRQHQDSVGVIAQRFISTVVSSATTTTATETGA